MQDWDIELVADVLVLEFSALVRHLIFSKRLYGEGCRDDGRSAGEMGDADFQLR